MKASSRPPLPPDSPGRGSPSATPTKTASPVRGMEDAIVRGSAFARTAIEYDRDACVSGDIEKFRAAAGEYEKTIRTLEPLADSSAIVKSKIDEYATRRTMMLKWIEDYDRSRRASEESIGSTGVSGPGTGSSASAPFSGTSPVHIPPSPTAKAMAEQWEKAERRTSAQQLRSRSPTQRGPKKSPAEDTAPIKQSVRSRERGASSFSSSTKSFDIAFGILFAGCIFLLVYYSLEMFRPYLIPGLVAAIFSIALRPVQLLLTQFFTVEAISDRDGEENARGKNDKYPFGNVNRDVFSTRNVLAFTAVLALLITRNTRLAFFVVAAILVLSTGLFLSLSMMRMMVRSGAVKPASGAIMVILGVLGTGSLILALGFAFGTVKDLIQGVQDLSQLTRAALQSSAENEVVLKQLGEIEERVREALAENQQALRDLSIKLHEYTGVNLSDSVDLILSDRQFSLEDLKSVTMANLPRSLDEVKVLAKESVAKLKDSEVNTSRFQVLVLSALKSVGSGLDGLFDQFRSLIERIGGVATFFGLVPILLARERSVLSILTDVLPLPKRSDGAALRQDLEMVIASTVFGLLYAFLVELVFVHLLFRALNLNFEYLAAFLAGLGSAVPFLPSGVVYTIILGIPQLAARRQWFQCVMLIGLHLLLQPGLPSTMQEARKRMKVGTSILNPKLFSLSILLSVPIFARSAMLFGPGLVTLTSVFYELYQMMNRGKMRSSPE
mmetsp:Transcript_15047/g.30565  ORF Transcript_15047/g.30565 Transcript_15047/m.30565 type:complete len:725 (-) Transcript_15047:1081-3255(-)